MPRIPYPSAAPVDAPAAGPDHGPVHWIDPARVDEDHPAVRDWQAHIAAGRIGTLRPADPMTLAIRTHNAALFARHRQGPRA